ncbi:hypothetical protein G4B88_013763 [Cannabis sativa]|uniref:SWIM-type domain-containing protein n=1 Tax=Cannabis sativa TaxID=3483 RepID=A0A7J6I045_CANSA|nr:hypothetical protein G4B88_013763 [Cannabis sativa]
MALLPKQRAPTDRGVTLIPWLPSFSIALLSVKLQKKTEKEQKSCPISTDMDKIFIVIQHSGYWDENQNYINFQVREMVIPNNCNYNTLVGMICNELKIDLGSTTLKIEYQGKDNYRPFHIEDDLEFYFYKELKKKYSDFTKSTSTHNELGIELGQAEEGTSNSDEEATVDMDADESENYISYARLVHPTNDVLFEVRDGCKKAIVDLSSRTCTCKRFQIDQLPCGHAMAVLKDMNKDAYEYCSSYYTKEAMLATYGEIVYPIPNEDTWEVPEYVKS